MMIRRETVLYGNDIQTNMLIAGKDAREVFQRGCKTLLCMAVLFAFASLAPEAKAQISVRIGGPPPVCPYGYYDYAPYACAPMGFYGPGYFYNGIFLGVGPWRNWGYGHGWGSHRFIGPRGGRYYPRHAYRGGHRSHGHAYRGRGGSHGGGHRGHR